MSTLQLDPRAELSIDHFARTTQQQIRQVISTLNMPAGKVAQIKQIPQADNQPSLFILCQDHWYILFANDYKKNQITVLDVWNQDKFQRLRHLYWPQAEAA